MALFVVFKDGTNVTFHLPFTGREHFAKMKLQAKNGELQRLYADGHELDHIIGLFNNIPFRHGWTLWQWEIANFIASNLMETK